MNIIIKLGPLTLIYDRGQTPSLLHAETTEQIKKFILKYVALKDPIAYLHYLLLEETQENCLT